MGKKIFQGCVTVMLININVHCFCNPLILPVFSCSTDETPALPGPARLLPNENQEDNGTAPRLIRAFYHVTFACDVGVHIFLSVF